MLARQDGGSAKKKPLLLRSTLLNDAKLNVFYSPDGPVV